MSNKHICITSSAVLSSDMDKDSSVFIIRNFVEQRELTAKAIEIARKKSEKSQVSMCEHYKSQHQKEMDELFEENLTRLRHEIREAAATECTFECFEATDRKYMEHRTINRLDMFMFRCLERQGRIHRMLKLETHRKSSSITSRKARKSIADVTIQVDCMNEGDSADG